MCAWMLVSAKAAGGVVSYASWGGGGAPSRYGPAARGEWTGRLRALNPQLSTLNSQPETGRYGPAARGEWTVTTVSGKHATRFSSVYRVTE